MEAMKGRLANKYFALAEEAYGEMEEEEVETTGQWNCEEGAPQGTMMLQYILMKRGPQKRGIKFWRELNLAMLEYVHVHVCIGCRQIYIDTLKRISFTN